MCGARLDTLTPVCDCFVLLQKYLINALLVVQARDPSRETRELTSCNAAFRLRIGSVLGVPPGPLFDTFPSGCFIILAHVAVDLSVFNLCCKGLLLCRPHKARLARNQPSSNRRDSAPAVTSSLLNFKRYSRSPPCGAALFAGFSLAKSSDVYALGVCILQLLTNMAAARVKVEVQAAYRARGMAEILDQSAGRWPMRTVVEDVRKTPFSFYRRRSNPPRPAPKPKTVMVRMVGWLYRAVF